MWRGVLTFRPSPSLPFEILFSFRMCIFFAIYCFSLLFICKKGIFKKGNKPIKRLTFPSKHSGCVWLSGTGRNVVQTCKPLSWLVHGTSTFLTRKNTETVKNWLQIAVELVFLPLTFAMPNLPVFGRFWQLQLTMCYYA